jgi:hypothetical protein
MLTRSTALMSRMPIPRTGMIFMGGLTQEKAPIGSFMAAYKPAAAVFAAEAADL